jgi:hypothetical protein
MRIDELFQPRQIDWLISRLVRKSQMTPQQINNGWCWVFAVRLCKVLGADATIVNTTGHEGVFPGHSVVLYQGRYYDAESPQGVEKLTELAYSQRLLRIRDGLEEFSDEVLSMDTGPHLGW